MALPTPQLPEGDLTCNDLVQCVYDLKEPDLRVYEALTQLGASRTEAVAEAVGREASVVYRNLQRLAECGVVRKEKQTLPGGGYCHVYKALPKAEVKARLAQCVEDWYAQMKDAIRRL